MSDWPMVSLLDPPYAVTVMATTSASAMRG